MSAWIVLIATTCIGVVAISIVRECWRNVQFLGKQASYEMLRSNEDHALSSSQRSALRDNALASWAGARSYFVDLTLALFFMLVIASFDTWLIYNYILNTNRGG